MRSNRFAQGVKAFFYTILSYGGTWFEARPQYRLNALTEISLLKKRVRKESNGQDKELKD